MKKMFKKAIDCITAPFIAVAVLLDESRQINEDGSWDKYNERKNQKLMKRMEKRR